MMKTARATALLLSFCALPAAAADDDIYIEFLWEPAAAVSLARPQTRLFISDGQHEHRICVAASGQDEDVGGLQLLIQDADGNAVSSTAHSDYRGRKKCYRAELGQGGTAGDWTVDALLGDGRRGSATIRVDASLQDSPLYHDTDNPYVVGRPNYDASIPAAEWVGSLTWAMQVDAQGRITAVEVEEAVGIGEHLRERAIAAGWLTRFGPDPAREGTPLRWRRTLGFAPD